MPQFSLSLIDPEETGVEGFDYDSDLWTSTDAIKMNVERYTGDSDRGSVMKIYGIPFRFGDTNPYTAAVLKFGDNGPGPEGIKFGSSWRGFNEGAYKDYTVYPGTKVYVSMYVKLIDADAHMYLYALDHTNGDAEIGSNPIIVPGSSTSWVF